MPVQNLLEWQRELEILSTLVTGARRGSGGVVLVEGPAGIGKTGLLAAATAQAEAAGMQVLAARGSELERELPYGIVRQLFERLVTGGSGAQRTPELKGPARQAASLFDDSDASPGDDASFAVLHGLYWLLYDLCAKRPVALVLDDLHWADIPSLRWLTYLLPRLDGLRLALCAASRPPEFGDPTRYFIEVLHTDRATKVLTPAPLTESAATTLLQGVLLDTAEATFCKACHVATGGNPLLLRELASVVTAEGLAPTEAGVARLWDVGARAVERRVSYRLERLGPEAVAFARAVAILGEGADLAASAALAQLSTVEALRVADALSAAEILTPGPPFGFVHPLVRSAVHDGLTSTERVTGHTRAARLLVGAGAAAERVAAHLLLVPPAGDPAVVTVLRSAADAALRRGSPESAVAYLERAVSEPPPPPDRSEILVRLGRTALQVNVASAAEHLSRALEVTDDPVRRGVVAEMLGGALLVLHRNEDAIEVLSRAVGALDGEHEDLRQRLEAELMNVTSISPAHTRRMEELVTRRRAEPVDAGGAGGVGRRMLDCMIACSDALAGRAREDAVARARRALNDRVLIQEANGSNSFLCGCWVLITADCDDAIPLLDDSLAWAHSHGSIYALAGASGWRALTWLRRGALTEAEADARDAMRAITTGRLDYDRLLTGSWLAEILVEQGSLAEAAAVLDELARVPLPPAWISSWVLNARAGLHLMTGEAEAGLTAAMACQPFTTTGVNPAFIPWRSQAALCLHALARDDQARRYAEEEVGLARQWGAPRALGRALRVCASVVGGAHKMALLEESLDVLEESPARLEHAKTLLMLGAVLGRDGRSAPARELLLQALELATLCGAAALAARARTELRAAGARPRTVALLTGVQALSPSELRVAELAATHVSNREIAQTLFITPKTVERHLTSTYRKLGVTRRADLATALGS